jgi:flagellar hook-associated protein 3 FlgL
VPEIKIYKKESLLMNELDFASLLCCGWNRIVSSSNGMRFGRADELLTEHKDRETFMLTFISDIEDVNMAEAITRVNNDQIALDVSYKLTAELSRMSLLNFI